MIYIYRVSTLLLHSSLFFLSLSNQTFALNSEERERERKQLNVACTIYLYQYTHARTHTHAHTRARTLHSSIKIRIIHHRSISRFHPIQRRSLQNSKITFHLCCTNLPHTAQKNQKKNHRKMAIRKLQQDMDKTYRKVDEQQELFQQIFDRLHDSDPSLKEKYEVRFSYSFSYSFFLREIKSRFSGICFCFPRSIRSVFSSSRDQ